MKRKQCPVCRSSNIVLFGGGITGTYECKKCGYTGVIVTEIVKIISSLYTTDNKLKLLRNFYPLSVVCEKM